MWWRETRVERLDKHSLSASVMRDMALPSEVGGVLLLPPSEDTMAEFGDDVPDDPLDEDPFDDVDSATDASEAFFTGALFTSIPVDFVLPETSFRLAPLLMRDITSPLLVFGL